ncbi:MAG: tetratricopeptide repeat protein [Pseudomonadota bacterium]|nr:tetratricopeptide repeat protein [Pseudomonadota bacterium]
MLKSTMFKKSLVVAAFTLGSAIALPAAAQSSAPVVCPGYEKGTTNLVGERVGKKVQKAFEAYNEDLIDDAITILSEIEPKEDFDKAYVNRFLGNIMATKDGMGPKALELLVSSVETKVLNDLEHSQTLKLVADLSLQEKEYEQAVKYYQAYLDFTCKEDPEVYTRMANAFYELKQYDKLIDPANKAIALYEEPNKNPYVLKLSSYYERKMYKETVGVAEDIVNTFPEEGKWWVQLGQFYLMIEDYKKSLATLEIAYNQGFLEKPNLIKMLSQLYATNNMPYRSAKVLAENIANGKIEKTADNLASVANSYHQAMEYETAAQYYQQAAEMSSDPEFYRKQGVLLLVAEDYKGAITALSKALERGVEDPGKVHFSLMEANFYAGDFKQAYEHIKEAKKDKTLRRNANAWEPYIKQKAKNRGINI